MKVMLITKQKITCPDAQEDVPFCTEVHELLC